MGIGREIRNWILASAACLAAGCIYASEPLPILLPEGAEITGETLREASNASLPISGWDRQEGVISVIARGVVERRAWRIERADIETLTLIETAIAALEGDGFATLFRCDTRSCGGFDFRFQLDLIGAPAMHVDLGDFRYALLERGNDEKVALVASRSDAAAYFHVTRVAATSSPRPEVTSTAPQPVVVLTPSSDLTLEEALRQVGRTVLSDLVFESGSASLGAGSYQSLSDLADLMRDVPTLSVVLVGHTDAQGSLEANVALSRRRAQAVRQRLIEAFGIQQGRIQAEGIGFLSPIASNATDAGRDVNRRVEVVVSVTDF
ncbi:MAG: OmpA family protein [Pseudomonadota bacterium]